MRGAISDGRPYRDKLAEDGVASGDSGSIAWQAWQRHSESASHPIFTRKLQGHFEPVLDRQFGSSDVKVVTLPDTTATPEAIEQFDAILALALRVTAESVRAVTRPAILARWGVGYDLIDTDALSAAAIPLCITPAGVRRPVAEAELTMIFALAKNLFALDRMARAGRWRQDMKGLGLDIEGSVLGSVGCGNIARELFRLARPLGFTRLLASIRMCSPPRLWSPASNS